MFEGIVIETVAGRFRHKSAMELTLEDMLAINHLPSNLFQAYVPNAAGGITPIPLDTPLTALRESSAGVLIRCMMNPDFSTILPVRNRRNRTDAPVTTIREISHGPDGAEEIIHEINAVIARQIVASKVSEFISTHSRERKLLAGISGGGDSNSLVRSLRSALSEGQKLIAFTLVLPPIWPSSAANRAEKLCADVGVEHLRIDGARMAELLHMKTEMSDFYYRFLHRFESDTGHFFGTFVISAVARKLCAELDTEEYCLGFNREDLLAELLFSIINGRRPLEFPVRHFSKIRLLMPVWELPKKILDACYPDYSRENYEERADRTTRQRALMHYLGHSVDDLYSNLGLSIMNGVRKLFEGNWGHFKHDEEFDLYIEEMAPHSVVNDVKQFLAEHFHPQT